MSNENSEKENRLLKLNKELNGYYKIRSQAYDKIEALTERIRRLESKMNKIQEE